MSKQVKRKTCIIIGGDKGGVGKSTAVAIVPILIYDNAGMDLGVIEIDNQRKLTTVLGAERVNLSLAATADLGEVSRNRYAAESFYNPVYLEWTKRNSITDLGANVTTSLLSWFRQCDIGELAAEDGIDFRFVACASPDEQALKSAVSAVRDATATFGPAAEFYVVLNDLSGSRGFEPYETNPAYRELLSLEAERKVSVLRIPYCDSLLLDEGKARGLNPLQTVHHADRLAEQAGLDLVGARVHKKRMMNWLRAVQSALEPLLTVSEPAQQAAVAAAASARKA